MATYEMDGVVQKVMDEQTFASGFSKRSVVIKTEDERFPQDIMFEFMKANAKLLDGIEPGMRVRVSFDIRGREYNERYFVSLAGWKIQNLDAQGAHAGGSDVSAAMPEETVLDDDDNLPF